MEFTGTGKTYAEKAIQTQHIDLWQNTYSTNFSLVQPLDSPGETSIACNSNEENSIIDHTAYIESELSLPLNAQSSLSRPRKPKPTQLPYSRPCRLKDQDKRAVSFPEVNTLRNPPDSLAVPIYEVSQRVVSLPAPGLYSDSSLEITTMTNTVDNSSSLDGLDTSFDTSYRSSQTGSIQRNPRRFLSSDTPATPSPPSSPDSILVVGNDVCISRAFLRQCSMSSSDKACDAEDESGWISWASSPPRPIPALHGPSSLPYARCPSGAEGTIIENADLPRVIWGLDPEDTHTTTQAEKPPKIVPSNIQNDSHSQISSSNLAICASKPIFSPVKKGLEMHLQPQRVHSENIKTSLEFVPTVVSPEPGAFGTCHIKTERSQVWDDIPINIHALDPYGKGYLVPNNVVQRAMDFADLRQPTRTSELKPTASAFVPKLSHQPLSPRIFVEPRPGSQITPGRRMSAIEIAQRYHAERQQAAFTPVGPSSVPSSLNSMGSPFFQTVALRSQPELESFSNSRSNLSKNSSGRDLAEIRQMQVQVERAQQELSNIIHLSNCDSPEIMSTSGLRMILPASAASSSGPVRSSTENNLLFFKQFPSTKPFTSEDQGRPRRFDLRQTQFHSALGPRAQSIPMTRLIQRRLSSVAEEELPRLSNKDSIVEAVDLLKGNPIVPKAEQRSMVTLAAMNARKERQVRDDKENAISMKKSSGNATPKKKWHHRKRPAVGTT